MIELRGATGALAGGYRVAEPVLGALMRTVGGVAPAVPTVMLSILFHHSNVRLPIETERWLGWLIVTPRLHGIHHSIVPEEQNSNWSSGLTIWDWLHGTLKRNVPQDAITIGVPAYREPVEVTLPKVLAMPFGEERPTWRLCGYGPEPSRETLPAAPERLPA